MSACDAVHELLVAHALGALEGSEAALVRDHLAACEPCRAADVVARADVALIEAPPVAPPPMAWSRIRARVAAGRAGDEPVRGPDLADPHDSQALIALSCSFCRGALVRVESVYCASCLAPHHPECWREYGRCSVMGCGEQRVVRPSERPDLAPARPSALDAPSRPPQAAADPATPTTPTPTVAPERRWDVAVRDASLGELCAALEREAGARIDLSAGLTDLLVREGRWRARTWRELLRELAAEHRLVLREDDDRLGLGVGQGAGPTERATATLERRTTQLLELAPRWRLSELRSGPPHEVAVAPAGRAIALLEGKSVRLLTPGRDATLTFDPPASRAVWSDDGSRLALVRDEECVVVRVDPAPAIVERIALDPTDPVTNLTWSPDATLGPTIDLASGRVISRHLVQRGPEETANPRNVPLTRVSPRASWLHVEEGTLRRFEATMPLFNGLNRDAPDVRPTWTHVIAGELRALDLSLDRSLVLVVADDVQLLDATTGKVVDDPIALRSDRHFSADLSPDGARTAWIDDGALFVRRRADGAVAGPDRAVVLDGASGAIVGCAWRRDGGALALWTSDGALGVVDTATLDRGDGAAKATLQLPDPLRSGALIGATWAGEALVVHSTAQDSREPRVVVAPTGAHRPDVVVDIDWTTPDGAPPRLDVFTATEPPPPASATESPPAPATETPAIPPPPPPPADEPAAPAPIPPALAHVRPGQRYTFRGHQGEVRTWEVLEVTAEGVVYREAVTLRGAKIGEPRRETWPLRRPEQIVRSAEPRRARREVGGQAFDCLVYQVGDTTRWVAVTGGWMAFPGEVRYERGGTVMLELTAVE